MFTLLHKDGVRTIFSFSISQLSWYRGGTELRPFNFVAICRAKKRDVRDLRGSGVSRVNIVPAQPVSNQLADKISCERYITTHSNYALVLVSLGESWTVALS